MNFDLMERRPCFRFNRPTAVVSPIYARPRSLPTTLSLLPGLFSFPRSAESFDGSSFRFVLLLSPSTPRPRPRFARMGARRSHRLARGNPAVHRREIFLRISPAASRFARSFREIDFERCSRFVGRGWKGNVCRRILARFSSFWGMLRAKSFFLVGVICHRYPSIVCNATLAFVCFILTGQLRLATRHLGYSYLFESTCGRFSVLLWVFIQILRAYTPHSSLYRSQHQRFLQLNSMLNSRIRLCPRALPFSPSQPRNLKLPIATRGNEVSIS